jgi:hypothetical protein
MRTPSAANFSRFGVSPAGRACDGGSPSMSIDVLDHPCASAWMKTKFGRSAGAGFASPLGALVDGGAAAQTNATMARNTVRMLSPP